MSIRKEVDFRKLYFFNLSQRSCQNTRREKLQRGSDSKGTLQGKKFLIFFCFFLPIYLQSQTKEFSLDSILTNIPFSKEYNKNKKLLSLIKKNIKDINGKQFRISTKKFNNSDVSFGLKRRKRLLIYCISLKSHIVMSYKHGGIGSHQHITIFELKNKEVISQKNYISNFHSTIEDLQYKDEKLQAAFEW